MIELPLKHPGLFEALGIAQPKVRVWGRWGGLGWFRAVLSRLYRAGSRMQSQPPPAAPAQNPIRLTAPHPSPRPPPAPHQQHNRACSSGGRPAPARRSSRARWPTTPSAPSSASRAASSSRSTSGRCVCWWWLGGVVVVGGWLWVGGCAFGSEPCKTSACTPRSEPQNQRLYAAF